MGLFEPPTSDLKSLKPCKKIEMPKIHRFQRYSQPEDVVGFAQDYDLAESGSVNPAAPHAFDAGRWLCQVVGIAAPCRGWRADRGIPAGTQRPNLP